MKVITGTTMLYIREICKKLEREGIYYFLEHCSNNNNIWCKVERQRGKIKWYKITFEYGEWAESEERENSIKIIIEEKETIRVRIETMRKKIENLEPEEAWEQLIKILREG